MKEPTATTERAAAPANTKTKGGVAGDASFLETLDQSQASSVLDLHRSNLLRLQCEELVEEIALKDNTSWLKHVAPYAEQVASILHKIPLQKMDESTVTTCPFVPQSQASFASALQKMQQQIRSSKSNTTLLPTLKTLPFAPPTQPSVSTPDQLMGRGNCALTKATGNAQVLPTFSLFCQLPATALMDSKDYSKGKYFDKRNLIVWHVAQQLSHKKLKQTIGNVYWTCEAGDCRKPTLILLPPSNTTTTTTTTTTTKETAKKNNKKQKTTSCTTKNHKFRLQIQFQMDSLDWIPTTRLFPNRSNVGGNVVGNSHQTTAVLLLGTPIYNHALLEDAYHQFLPIPANEKKLLLENNESVSDSDSEDEMDEHYPHWRDTLLLAKVWCLQRGLLRNHDGFTTDHLAILILYLYRTKQANARMAPLQVFAVMLKCLSETNWTNHRDGTTDNATTNKDNKNNLIRSTPSEASRYSTNTNTSINSSNKQKQKQAVLVLPLPGKTEAQTIAHAPFHKLYQKQVQESPLTKNDPKNLIDLYRQQVSEQGPVMLDSSMKYNFWGRVSASFMERIQYEARKSLKCVHGHGQSSMASNTFNTMEDDNNNSNSNNNIPVDKPFPVLFLTSARFWDAHDLYFQVPIQYLDKDVVHYKHNHKSNINNAKLTKIVAQELLKQGHLAADAGMYEAAVRGITALLQLALGDRVRAIRVLSTGNGLLTNEISGSGGDSDQIPLYAVHKGVSSQKSTNNKVLSPTGSDSIVVGISLNPDNCHRIVDRGPPAEDTEAVQAFLDLWGDKAELRRFKDGAIVQAVVWNTTQKENLDESVYVRYENEDSMQGGIVERIVRYSLQRHFMKQNKKQQASAMTASVKSSLRDMSSLIDGIALNDTQLSSGDADANHSPWFRNPTVAHRNAMKAYESLASFLKNNSLPTLPVPGTLETKKSRLGLPLSIDAVEPLSPTLRYSELFPPIPHPFAGSSGIKGMKKVSGAISCEPINIQIRFGSSSKWPTDLKAIGAAKTAMLIQLANGIENMKTSSRSETEDFDGIMNVTPGHLDIGYKGYVFRVHVRADPEIRLLRGLVKPSPEAAALLRSLTREHIITAMHHSMIHSIHTLHASASAVVRLAKRWVSGHLLSGLIPLEAIELLVAKIFSDRSSPLDAPGSVTTGFLRFLHLLETHDWVREPLIVDPHGHIDDSDRATIMTRFEQARGPTGEGGPPMYIVSPYDRQGTNDSLDTSTLRAENDNSNDSTSRQQAISSSKVIDSMAWTPGFTSTLPEWVVLTRAVALAKKTRAFLTQKRLEFNSDGWSAAFQETSTSFKAYSALLRVEPELAVDEKSSSTGTDLNPSVVNDEHGGVLESAFTCSMRLRYVGPKCLRVKLYKNMRDISGSEQQQAVLHDWRPVDALVNALRNNFGHYALFFYNDLCPDVIAVLWRPKVFAPKPFSVMGSEFAQPCVASEWKPDTMVMVNGRDVLREMSQIYDGIVTKVRLFQAIESPEQAKRINSSASSNRKRKSAPSNWEHDESESNNDSDMDDDDDKTESIDK